MNQPLPGTPAHKSLESLVAAAPGTSPSQFLARLEQTHILLIAQNPGMEARERDRQVQAYVLLNLLPRMFPNVYCAGIDPATLFDPAAGHARRINTPGPDLKPTIVVALVDEAVRVEPAAPVVYADNRGWTAYVSRERPWSEPAAASNPVGAYFAGGLAVAEVFNQVFREAFPRAEIVAQTHTFDLVTLEENQGPNYEPSLAQRIDLGDAAIVGLGSVGQAVVDILAHVPSVSGSIRLIDPEATDPGNESRYVLSYPNNRGSFKVLIARDRLKRAFPLLRVDPNGPFLFQPVAATLLGVQELGKIRVLPRETKQPWFVPPVDYGAHHDLVRGHVPYERLLCSVDSEQARRDVQFGLHRVVLNAWTDTADGRMGYAVGRHTIRGPDACLACVYHPAPRHHEPTPAEFVQELTGWPPEVVTQRLAAGSAYTVTAADLGPTVKARGLTPEQLEKIVGKSLEEVLHGPECGLANLPGPDREQRAQVLHVPILAGCHLATQALLDALGHGRVLKNLAIFDALRPPNRHAKAATRSKEPGCLCGDAVVQATYRNLWGPRRD